jgi:hypothetical protein
MKLKLVQARHCLAVVCLLAGTGASWAAQWLLNPGFEQAPFPTNWNGGSGLTNVAGLNASATAARLPYNTLATLNQSLAASPSNFTFDVSFLVAGTNEAQAFHVELHTTAGKALDVRSGSAGRLQTLNGSDWLDVTALSGGATFNVPANQTVRLRVIGRHWGSTNASYDLAWSDSGGGTLTHAAVGVGAFAALANAHAGGVTHVRFDRTATAHNSFVVDDTALEDAAVAAPTADYQVVIPVPPPPVTNAIVNISGTYPHLAVFSAEGEIGMGAVMPWGDKLWFVTYPPHQPNGSADKLWMVDSNLTLTAHPASVGCTDANRLIHRESQQLNIGHYLIDSNGTVRAISPGIMPGRLTGSARHLTDPTNKIYIATMEEGLYEVDVNTLAVTTLKADAQNQTSGAGLILPGNHGKGLYSGQGRLIYANNGDTSWSAGSDQISGFSLPAGLLVENFGSDFVNGWSQLERKNFTEVTGPGGIYGNTNSSDPIWSVGWDKRSVILKLLDGGVWRNFRLPKGSYTHDSFQGWYTEWPRIREITNNFLLMHMHGMFYSFPKSFSVANTAGLRPLCTYLKMPVDYCWWNGQLVMGRDDASTTGGNIWAGQSHSAPWFGQISDLETWGKPAGFGGVWKEDAVTNGVPSEPFLVKGFQRRLLHLKHTTAATVNFTLQHDATGNGTWVDVAAIPVTNGGYVWYLLPSALDTFWVRLVTDNDATGVTAYFHLQNPPQAPAPELFAGIADAAATNAVSDGILRPQGGDARTLQFAATVVASNGAVSTAYYEMGGSLQLRRATNATAENSLRTTYGLSSAGFSLDAASVIYTEGANRFRLPRGSSAHDSPYPSGWPRGVREVVTERNMFQAHGTFYELPKSGDKGSGGFRRIRPITSHGKHISDFASWRGLFAVAGIPASAGTNTHVYRSDDGQAAVWFGNVDDLWRMGAPRGVGGPWKNSIVTNGVASDPYLMFGYERKELELSHGSASPVTFTVEVDFAADNTWSSYAQFTVPAGETVKHVFPAGYSAHWVRVKSDATTTATAQFTYGPAAPQITGATMQPDGGFQLSFTGNAGEPYTVRASQDLGILMGNWPVVSSGTFGTNGVSWLDVAATNWPHRFYSISIP